ncbi:MAG TPA: FadR/GntR family transcriptional regulator [Bauldia sp.]|nr:FadR/GntR family transcriptional regulator [Bauldia sp.]
MLSPTALFGASRKRNLFAHVVEDLGSRIVRGELKPGDPFPNEADLGREFGASRSVIREAVKSLAAKGLLESRTRTGIRVLDASHWNLLDLDVLGWRYAAMEPHAFFRELFEIRRMIEPEASALAAERATADEIGAIGKAFRAMESADNTTETAILADLDFHRGILQAARNDLLLQMGKLIGVGLLVSYRISTDHYTVFLGLHRDVLTAIRRHRPAAARRTMDRLLTETRNYLDIHIEASRG